MKYKHIQLINPNKRLKGDTKKLEKWHREQIERGWIKI